MGKPLGVRLKCNCGNVAFTVHVSRSEMMQLKCTNCEQLYSITSRVHPDYPTRICGILKLTKE